jgi:hypothetical protein
MHSQSAQIGYRTFSCHTVGRGFKGVLLHGYGKDRDGTVMEELEEKERTLEGG